LRHRLQFAAVGFLAVLVLAPDKIANAQTGPISGNPAATTFPTGIGWLGHTLGIPDSWGVTLGGVYLADFSTILAGGAQPGATSFNNAVSVGMTVDAQRLLGWSGATFGAVFTQYDGDDTNARAGSVTGYNGIVPAPPFHRTELNEFWYLQSIVQDKLQVRIGRTVPTYDFNNVSRPLALKDDKQNIAAVSGLLYTALQINPTMLAAIPGFYDPGDGVTVNFTPTSTFYVNLGVYDGNKVRGDKSGLQAPSFDGTWFTIGEVGFDWLLGEGQHPGKFAVGTWRQTGLLHSLDNSFTQDGAGGIYLFGSQRIAFGVNERVPNSSVSVFYQFGNNDAATLPVNRYYGVGVTGFGLIGNRDKDSMGFGATWSKLSPNIFTGRTDEVTLQAYYQANLYAAVYLQPTLTFIPLPGASPTIPAAFAGTLRLTVLF
jgi:porin